VPASNLVVEVTFEEAVASYRSRMSELGLGDLDVTQIEAAVESVRDWSRHGDLDEVRQWFLAQRSGNSMVVTKIPIGQCRGWHVEEGTGYLRHESGEFFVVEAIEVSMSETREVGAGGWCQPVMTQVGDDGGILGLPRQRFDGVPHYLVQAKAEPGNYELVSLSPAVQATFSNLKRAHGGRLPTFASWFYPEVADRCSVVARAWLSEDGGRLFNKRNLGIVIELPPDEAVELPDGFRWLSMWQIKQLFNEDAWVNPHLFRLISMVGS
jgi:oxidase EvaA